MGTLASIKFLSYDTSIMYPTDGIIGPRMLNQYTYIKNTYDRVDGSQGYSHDNHGLIFFAGI